MATRWCSTNISKDAPRAKKRLTELRGYGNQYQGRVKGVSDVRMRSSNLSKLKLRTLYEENGHAGLNLTRDGGFDLGQSLEGDENGGLRKPTAWQAQQARPFFSAPRPSSPSLGRSPPSAMVASHRSGTGVVSENERQQGRDGDVAGCSRGSQATVLLPFSPVTGGASGRSIGLEGLRYCEAGGQTNLDQGLGWGF